MMSVQQRSNSPASLSAPMAGGSGNPFAVSRVGLGEQEFLEPRPGFVAELVERLERSGWRGQIVGPHGSGKTTLTLAMAQLLRERFERFSWLVVQPLAWFGSRPRGRVQLAARSVRADEGTLLELVAFQLEEPGNLLLPNMRSLKPEELCFVDGLELLPAWRQRQVVNAAKAHAVVFTTHRPFAGGLAHLAELRPDLEIFRRLVSSLLPASGALGPDLLERAFDTAEGDFRRGLSFLYDEWESQQRAEISGRENAGKHAATNEPKPGN